MIRLGNGKLGGGVPKGKNNLPVPLLTRVKQGKKLTKHLDQQLGKPIEDQTPLLLMNKILYCSIRHESKLIKWTMIQLNWLSTRHSKLILGFYIS